MKLFDKVLNIFLIVILTGSVVWFLVTNRAQENIQTLESPTLNVVKDFNWEPIIPGISSIIVFFLRYFLIDKRKNKENKKISLLDHLIFDTIEDMLENNLKHLTFGSEGRTEALRLMISIQLKTYSDTLKEFILKNDKYEDSNEFRKKLRGCIFDMVNKTEKQWREAKIPEILINKYSALYRQRIELLLADILNASITASIENNQAMEKFLNDARIIILTGLQEDVIIALKTLNGELSGLTFNGKQL